MNNVFLFTGEEKFQLSNTLNKWKQAFINKYGGENYFVYKGDGIIIPEMINSIFSGGLFQNKKLLILYGFPKDTDSSNKIKESTYQLLEEKMLANIEKIPGDVNLVFVSYSPDKRTKGYKNVAKKVQVKQFDKLQLNDLIKYVEDYLEGKMDKNNINYFLSIVGTNLFVINNELIKINNYCEYNNIKNIDKSLIDNLVYSNLTVDSFKLLDSMFFDRKKSIELIIDIQKTEDEPFKFLGMLYWSLRNTIQMIDIYDNQTQDSKLIASLLGVHPFVVYKNINKIENYIKIKHELFDFFNNLLKLENGIKNGNITKELFRLEIKKMFI